MKGAERSLIKVLLLDWSSIKFAFGVIFGMAFSIAVILCTIGLMDGFETTLKQALAKTQGDIYFYSKNGFFNLNQHEKDILNSLKIDSYSEYIETEAFLIDENASQAVLLRGINLDTYPKVTGLEARPQLGGVVIGTELALKLKVSVGQDVVVALASGNRNFKGLPLIIRLRVDGIVEHGIYQKDLRLMYVNLSDLQTWLNTENKINVVTAKIQDQSSEAHHALEVDQMVYELGDRLGFDFRVRPFWHEFSTLIEAVKVEKIMIGLILQVIVVVSIFNVIAFTTFINERKSKELFLFRALGLSQKRLASGWFMLVFILWSSAILASNVFVWVFDWLLANWSFLHLPGDIYYLGRMKLNLETGDYLLVFLVSLIWVLLLASYSLIKLSRQSLLSGLRKEFN